MIGRAFILLAVACVAYGSVVKDLKGVPRSRSEENNSNGVTEGYCTPGEMTCSGCNTTQVCLPDGISTLNIICEFPEPFCDFNSGSCGSQPSVDECGSEQPDDFICFGEGYFPDPRDCTKFHHCRRDSPPVMISCEPNGYIPGSKWCSSDPCKGEPINCTDKAGVKIPFGRNKSYFAICPGRHGSILVQKCPDDEVLNYEVQKCEKRHF